MITFGRIKINKRQNVSHNRFVIRLAFLQLFYKIIGHFFLIFTHVIDDRAILFADISALLI